MMLATPYDVAYSAALPQETFAVYPPTQGFTQSVDVVVEGFPMDVRDREIRNFARFLPGFQDCKVERRKEASVICGTFIFNELFSAKNAVRCISGCEFEENVILRARIAGVDGVDEAAAANQQGEQATTNDRPTMSGDEQVPVFPAFAFAPGASVVAPPMQFRPIGGGNKAEKDNPPCNTLFIGNLTEGVSEDELNEVFGKQPGFQQLKVARTSKGISAFIEFADTQSAIECHTQHQGLVLKSSERGAIRVQFSKNPFGYKQKQSPRIPSNGNMPMAPRMAVHPGYAAAYPMPPMAAAPAGFPNAQPIYAAPNMPGFAGQQQ